MRMAEEEAAPITDAGNTQLVIAALLGIAAVVRADHWSRRCTRSSA